MAVSDAPAAGAAVPPPAATATAKKPAAPGAVRKKEYLSHVDSPHRTLLSLGWFRSMTFAALATLSLGCMGNAVLPLADTFARTGVVVGIASALVMCLVNVYTCRLLLRQARVTGAHDYECLGHLTLGPWWQKVVELSNWVLLFFSITGSIAQIGEAGAQAIRMVWCFKGDSNWLLGTPTSDGEYAAAVLVILYVVFLVAPWAMAREMKELEYAGWVGYPIVLWMVVSIMVRCIRTGFPALANGQLPIVGFTGLSNIASSVSVWGFAFYIQPLMMPMYAEMPPGNPGQQSVAIAVNSVLCGTALVPYLLIAFFGAAAWGDAAKATGNVLLNDIYGEFVDGKLKCPSRTQGALNICMTVYLAVTIPPLEYALRHVTNSWVSQLKRRFRCLKWIPKRDVGKRGWLRNVIVSACDLTAATLLALFYPGNSASLLTITGATGVLFVSFIIPIVNHFVLLTNRARCQRGLLDAPCCPADEEAAISGEDSVHTRTGSVAAGFDRIVRMNEMDDELARASRRASSLAEGRSRGSFGAEQPHSDRDGPTGGSARWHPESPRRASLRSVAEGTPLADAGAGAKAAVGDDADALSTVSEESDTPCNNTYRAIRYASPLTYRKRQSDQWRFWAQDVALPLVVLAAGVFGSVCALIGVAEELGGSSAEAATEVVPK